jgi:hypothetical protein
MERGCKTYPPFWVAFWLFLVDTLIRMAGRDTESRGCEGIALVGGLIKSTRQLLMMYGISRVRYPIAKKTKKKKRRRKREFCLTF